MHDTEQRVRPRPQRPRWLWRLKRNESLFYALGLGLSAATATMMYSFIKLNAPTESPLELAFKRLAVYEANLKNTQDKIHSQQAEMEARFNAMVHNLTSRPADTQIATVLAKLEDTSKIISEVAKRQSDLEAALQTDSLKAVSFPILRRDVDNLTQGYHGEIQALRAEIDRVYDTSKWHIALIIGMLVTILSALLLNILKARKES